MMKKINTFYLVLKPQIEQKKVLAFFLLVSMFSARFLGPQKKALEVTRVQHRHTCCQTKTHIAHFFFSEAIFFWSIVACNG